MFFKSEKFTRAYYALLAVLFFAVGCAKIIFDQEYLIGTAFAFSAVSFVVGLLFKHTITQFTLFGTIFQIIGLGANSIWLWLFGFAFFVTELIKERVIEKN